jgi:signal peptide peptidase SppA
VNKFEPLAILPTMAESLPALAAEPRQSRGISLPSQAEKRIGYVELVGLMVPDYLQDIRRQILKLTADAGVKTIVLFVDSPGGYVTGTLELCEVVKRAAKAKPVHVLIEGRCCSAAMWAVAYATTISATESSLVGSIGAFHVLVDDSEYFQRLGIKILKIATGNHKGVGVHGVAIDDEQVQAIQRQIDLLGLKFQIAIAKGRGLSDAAVEKLADGQAHYAATARHQGLIDHVQLTEDALADLPGLGGSDYSTLGGKAASEKLDQLAIEDYNRRSRVGDKRATAEYPEDVPEFYIQQTREKYPALAAAADQHESHRNRDDYHRAIGRF